MDLVQLIESTTGGYNEKIIEDIEPTNISTKLPTKLPIKEKKAKKKSLDDIISEKQTGLDKIIKSV